MKSTAKIILLAFVAGLAGAFTFQQFLVAAQVNEVIREVPANVRQANYRMDDNALNATRPFREASRF